MTSPLHLQQPMPADERLKAAWSELTLVLSFFPRIDTKLSVVLGLDLGMLAILAARLPAAGDITLLHLAFGLPLLVFLGRSMFGLWRGAFPHLEGGTNSLVYFRSICRMKETSFRQDFASLSASQLADDLLNQVWRNSRILVTKFESLRIAYVAMLGAALCWSVLLFFLSDRTTG